MGLKNYVDVAISLQTLALSQAGFGTVLILTTAANAAYDADLIREYADIDEVAGDWDSADDAYLAAAAAFAQDPKPAKVKIALAEAPVAGVGTLTFAADVVTSNTGTVTVNGTPIAYTYATSHQATMTALAAAIQALEGVATAAVGADPFRVITITTDAGYPLTVTASAITGGAGQTTVAYAETTPAVTLPDSLDDIVEEDNDWYGLGLADRKTKHNIMNVAAWAESRTKIFGACNNDAAVLAGTDGNVLLLLKAKGLNRTFYEYSDSPGQHPEIAIMAQQLAEEPGAATWMFKTCPGITRDVLSTTERNNVLNNNGNIYTTQQGRNMFEQGKMAGGQFIDIIHSRDWLETRLAEDIFALIAQAKKIPYTNAGASLLEAAIRKRLDEAKRRTILTTDEDYVLTIPKVAAQQTADRAARYFPGITFSGVLAGAIHKVQIRGSIAV